MVDEHKPKVSGKKLYEVRDAYATELTKKSLRWLLLLQCRFAWCKYKKKKFSDLLSTTIPLPHSEEVPVPKFCSTYEPSSEEIYSSMSNDSDIEELVYRAKTFNFDLADSLTLTDRLISNQHNLLS